MSALQVSVDLAFKKEKAIFLAVRCRYYLSRQLLPMLIHLNFELLVSLAQFVNTSLLLRFSFDHF